MEQRLVRIFASEGFLSLTCALRAAQVCRRWSLEITATALWSPESLGAASISVARALSNVARKFRRGRPSKIMCMDPRPALTNFVSGEMTLESLARLLAAARVRSGETFADLGCGAGRQLLGAMALVPGGLRKLIGYELMEGYLETARARLSDQPAVLIHEDFTERPEEWLDADVVLAVATCFDRVQMTKISLLATRLRREGARFITIDKPLLHQGDLLPLSMKIQCCGDWGPAVGYLYVLQRPPLH